MSLVTLPYTFTVGQVIIASQHNSNFQTIFNDYDGNITDANIASNAQIAYTKLALNNTIKSTDLLSTMTVPIANLPVGVAVGDIVQLISGTAASLPAVSGALLTNIPYAFNSITNYVSGTSSGTAVLQANVSIYYGLATVGATTGRAVTGLPFSSATSYMVTLTAQSSATNLTGNYNFIRDSGSQFTIYNGSSSPQDIGWIAIGS